MNHDKISLNLYEKLEKEYPDQTKKIMAAGSGDISPEFLGFVNIYRRLAEIIPKDWTVIDLGCAYAPQSYYFRKHKKYIGVNIGTDNVWRTANSQFYFMKISDYIKAHKAQSKEFAICSYVPPWGDDNMKLVKENWKNVFVYYPE